MNLPNSSDPQQQKKNGSMAERKEAAKEQKAKQREESNPETEAQRDKRSQLNDKADVVLEYRKENADFIRKREENRKNPVVQEYLENPQTIIVGGVKRNIDERLEDVEPSHAQDDYLKTAMERGESVLDLKKPWEIFRKGRTLFIDPFKAEMNKNKHKLRGLVRTLGPGNTIILAYTDIDGEPTGVSWVVKIVVDENGIEVLKEYEVDVRPVEIKMAELIE